ncbi:RNA-directed DNA polymerase, eukaryota, reverse transcriptase zinc-binding domain protein [Tanacetum coccineum]
MESMDLSCVRSCWGNTAFDYVHSDSVGYSGGILCVWDSNAFCKNSTTVSDYFIMVRGKWRYTGKDLLIIVVYAPQELKEKMILWEYLLREIRKEKWWLWEILMRNSVRAKCLADLEEVEEIIDRGDGNEEIANKRAVFVKDLLEMDKLTSLELAQKAKIKWAIEGDENSRFFHGILNKKRNSLSIRGIMADGIWVDDPSLVKHEFLTHFSSRFSQPGSKRALVHMQFPNTLSIEQQLELDSMVSNEEIKRAVWDCGMDKTPGPDGFTFGFYRHFWNIIEEDVYDVVKSPTEEFQFCKGLKQGDPLSPFLFILIMERLHLSFLQVVDAGLFNGIKLDPSVIVSHMFYADDVVFVGQWCEGNINTLIHVLECFYRASGLRINMSKSKLMGLHVDNDKLNGAALKLGCLTFKTPFKYLGSIVGGSMSRIQAWNEVVERVKLRLSKWKMKTLSIGGRLTLLRSVLGSIPLFHMSIFKAPSGVLRKLESIRGHFFNGHDLNCNKASWVNWKAVIAPKDKGGLGVPSLYALNRAIHGEEGNMGVTLQNGYSSCWMNIVNEARVLASKGIDIIKYIRFKLGNGEAARFWEDRWLEGDLLKQRFPRLYALDTHKYCTVAMKFMQPSLCFSFRRSPRGGAEQAQFEALNALAQGVRLTPMVDRWSWSLTSSRMFSVASIRHVIDNRFAMEAVHKTRWSKYVLIKFNVFAWKVMTDSLPSRFNVSRRGIPIDSIKCGICDLGVETSRHLFFSCYLARQITPSIVRWWDIPYADLESYKDWKAWLTGIRLPSKNKLMLEGVFYVLWWFLWVFRNKMVHDAKILRKEWRTREVVDEDKEIEENVLSTKDVLSTNKDKVSTNKEKVSTDKPIVSTDASKVSTDRHIEGTDEKVEGTEEHNEGTKEQTKSTDGQRKGTEDQFEEGSATHATQTPTSTIFGDDETIAKVLLNMSQAKAVSREKEKGVELKDIEEDDRPRPTSTRSLLTLKPLPNIDPKDKGKKKIEEDDESESESDGIPKAEKTFKQLESDEEMARKIQEEWEDEEERNRIAEEKSANEALIRNFDDIKARLEADRLLAEKLQEQEREQFTIEERAKFLHDTIAAQRRFLARQRSEAIRNKPLTKNQLRN